MTELAALSLADHHRVSHYPYRALVSEAKEQGMVTWGHLPDLVGLRQVLAVRQKSVEHLYGYIQALHHDPAPGPSLCSSADRYGAVQRVDTLIA